MPEIQWELQRPLTPRQWQQLQAQWHLLQTQGLPWLSQATLGASQSQGWLRRWHARNVVRAHQSLSTSLAVEIEPGCLEIAPNPLLVGRPEQRRAQTWQVLAAPHQGSAVWEESWHGWIWAGWLLHTTHHPDSGWAFMPGTLTPADCAALRCWVAQVLSRK